VGAAAEHRDQRVTATRSDATTFASLHISEFRRMWFAGLVVFAATGSQVIARGWLARELTGTNAGLGGVMLAFGAAMLVATPFGGVVADRFPKRAVLVASQLVLMLSTLLVGVAITLDVVAYWMVLAMGGVQALAFSMFGPSRLAFTAEVVPAHLLTNGIVLTQLSNEVMRVGGPSIAGAVIAAVPWGLEAVFYVSTALLAVGTIVTTTMPAGRPTSKRARRSTFADMADGLLYVRRRPEVALLVTTLLGVVMVGFPFVAFLPGVSDGIFDNGSGGFGLLLGASAVGGLVAGLYTARRSTRFDPWRWVQWTGLGFGAALVVFGAAPTFLAAMVVVVAVGAGNLTFQTTTNSLVLNLTDIEYHGRVQSIALLGFGGYGVAALPLGALADAIGLRTTLVGMGAVVLAIMGLFAVRRRRFRGRELALDLG
jgi:MFS family permease